MSADPSPAPPSPGGAPRAAPVIAPVTAPVTAPDPDLVPRAADAGAILERVADAYAAFDSQLRYVAVNAAGERSMGRPRAALLGRGLTEAFPSAAGSESERQYRRVAATGVEAHFTEHYVGDGLDNWVEVHAYPTGAAPPHGIAVFWREITGRVRAERALRAANAALAARNAELQAQQRELVEANHQLQEQAAELEEAQDAWRATADRLAESEARLRRVADSGIVAVFFWNLAGGITEANDAFLALLGHTRDDLAAGRVDWRAMTPPEYAAVDAAAVAELRATGRHGQVAKEYVGRDGRRVPVVIQSAFLDGSETRGVCVCLDDTARRHAEARLGRVLAQTPAAIAVLFGPDHVVQSANETFLRLLGRRDYVGRPARAAAPELAEQGFLPLLDGVYRTGRPFAAREAPLVWDRDGDGTTHEGFFDFVYQPITDAAGAVEGVLVFAVEVTARVRARHAVEGLNAELRAQACVAEAARAEADRANRAKSEFLATMSHELRTPLNAIGGYAELIELGIRGPVTPEQRADLEKIQRSQRHLLGLINGVLNYARVEAGAVHYDVADVPLDEVLATCEALVAPQVRAKGLTLRYEAAPGALRACADREKVQQVVLNLLSNAVKFTEPDGRIVLSGAAAGTAVRVAVRDTGIGIAPEQLARVFEPFVQVDASLTRTREGTGLGLAISRDLARGMGGDLTAESTPGVGSTFTLTLPGA